MKEDWPLIPLFTFEFLGFVVAILDFVFIQGLVFQFTIWVVFGAWFLVMAGTFRYFPRKALINAGFGSLWSTGRLRTVEGHKLVKEGIYQYIRHPIYLGESARSLCIPFLLSSLYGLAFGSIAVIMILIRIQIEEKMLLEIFGQEYEDYRKSTKKIIPYIY